VVLGVTLTLEEQSSLQNPTRAEVGDVIMTVTGTCRANGVNPFDYMMAVARNADAVRSNPEE
jgi:citrate lyase beta subunit